MSEINWPIKESKNTFCVCVCECVEAAFNIVTVVLLSCSRPWLLIRDVTCKTSIDIPHLVQ